MRRLVWIALVLSSACSGPKGGVVEDVVPASELGGPPVFALDGGGGDTTGCVTGQKRCDGNAASVCQADGTWSAPEPCTGSKVCSQGICGLCADGQRLCQGSDIIECTSAGSRVVQTCTGEETCYNAVCLICIPGRKECRLGPDGKNQTWECQTGGQDSALWVQTATCPADSDCVSGICISPCQSDIKINTNQGCDYYAVDLENVATPGLGGTLAPADSQFAVIVSNPSKAKTITVTVHETQTGPPVRTATLPPGGLQIITLDPRNITGTMKGAAAWRVKGDQPFVAYQFNPLDNTNPVFSNDASLLLPVNALGRDYIAMTGTAGGPFVTVVSPRSNTQVTVVPSSATLGGGDIPALLAGQSYSTTLNAGEVLNLLAAPGGGLETLTGTRITASSDVVVFAGNVATTTGSRCCADHLEQQMFPVSKWGSHFVASKSRPRQAELDHWRILASQDGTTVMFSNGVANPVALDAGQYTDLASAADFVITADKPILVGQFLASSFEILPAGVYCTADGQCASGLCSAGGGNGAGRCLDTCQGAQGSCSVSDYCLANVLFGEAAPSQGASCFSRPCGAGLPACPGGSKCVTLDNGSSFCFKTCVWPSGSCGGGTDCAPTTQFGDLCVPRECNASFECGGGWCNGGVPTGQCFSQCSPASGCPKAGEVCLPPGLSSDPSITKGICLDGGCTSDATCEPGHTCVISTAGQPGSCEPIGDPAFILAVPTEQYRAEYTFLAPNAYKEDYVNVLAPVSASVTLDGQPVPIPAFQVIEGTGYMVARLPLEDGPHTLVASEPVGVVVYGYHDDVSYGYPGGANLFDLGR